MLDMSGQGQGQPRSKVGRSRSQTRRAVKGQSYNGKWLFFVLDRKALKTFTT